MSLLRYWIFLFSRSMYAKVVKTCIKNILRKCQDTTHDKNVTKIEFRSRNFVATRSYFCDDGMLNSFKRNKLPDCREEALAKVQKCARSFHTRFRENKGSPSLCRLVNCYFALQSLAFSSSWSGNELRRVWQDARDQLTQTLPDQTKLPVN